MEGDLFLELREAEKTEELAAGSWLTLGAGKELMSLTPKWHHANPAAFVAFQRIALRSE